ncbi:hypothetical protein TNCV_4524161 [Trichonephila clavipes]|nr:hypothetical protein TNCV_4524161 [Trichonephila clavipes]
MSEDSFRDSSFFAIQERWHEEKEERRNEKRWYEEPRATRSQIVQETPFRPPYPRHPFKPRGFQRPPYAQQLMPTSQGKCPSLFPQPRFGRVVH